MERNSTNENFEHFLRQNAEDFRIYPSEKTWDNISRKLHKPKRRRYFGLLLLLVSSSLIGYSVYEFGFSSSDGERESIYTPQLKKTNQSSNRPSVLGNSSNGEKKAPLSSVVNLDNKKTINSNTHVSSNPIIDKDATGLINATSSQKESESDKERWMADLLTINSTNTQSTQNLLLGQKSSLNISSLDKTSDVANNDIKKPLQKARKKNSRLGFMFFFTPTVSYRKLTENKSYLRSSPVGAPYSFAALYDINNAVTHKPDIGLEFGATTKYTLTKNVKLRAGVQFNINRYDIKAFKYIPEMATIALNNGYGVDSVNTLSKYRNLNGASTDWLQNFYFQVSTPIGVEVKLKSTDKMHIGVASTIQPTYVLGDRAYLITADYKNYAQVPWLIRRWNVNTNLETFVAYSSGKINWQIGPQVRYQLLSSFVSKYPVKENLFDFGLKVGISLNQNQ